MTEHKGNIERDLEMLKLFDLARKVVEEADESAKKYPTSEEVQIVVVEPNKRPYKKTVKNDLKTTQDIIGGYMENIFIGDYDGIKLAIVCNEDGIRLDLPLNRRIIGRYNLLGTFYITGYNKQGDKITLPDFLAETYIKRFSPLEVYL